MERIAPTEDTSRRIDIEVDVTIRDLEAVEELSDIDVGDAGGEVGVGLQVVFQLTPGSTPNRAGETVFHCRGGEGVGGGDVGRRKGRLTHVISDVPFLADLCGQEGANHSLPVPVKLDRSREIMLKSGKGLVGVGGAKRERQSRRAHR